jgi:hypothetical protein
MQRMETYLCSGGRRRRRWRGGCFLLFPGVAPLPFGLFFFSAYDAPLFPCFLGFSMGYAPVLSSGFRSQKSPVFVCVLASSSAGSLPSFSFLSFSFLSQFFFVWFVLSVWVLFFFFAVLCFSFLPSVAFFFLFFCFSLSPAPLRVCLCPAFIRPEIDWRCNGRLLNAL